MRFIKILRRRPVAEARPKKLPGEAFGVLVLAAGQGSRMESDLPKVLHPVGGRAMILHVLRAVSALKPQGVGVVIGHGAERVREVVDSYIAESQFLKPVTFLRQNRQEGSGHAVLAAAAFVKRFPNVLVAYGDTPLLTYDTLLAALTQFRADKAQATILTAKLANPKGYGRVVRSPMGEVLRIVEDSEAGPKEAALTEVNSGVGLFASGPLLDALREVSPAGPKNEIYLTKAVEILRAKGGRVTACPAPSADEVLGVNTRLQLASAERVLGRRTLERLMLSGATVADPGHTYVDATVEVGSDVTLLPGTFLKGKTTVGRGARLGPYAYIEDCEIGAGAEVRMSYCVQAEIGEGAAVGPFSHLRPGASLGAGARVGNFSEIKASRLGAGAKVPHLSYVGDAEVGDNVNLGAGTITCNFDGAAKHPTVIEKNAFIGSNVNLVAPVKIGAGALVGAGSTITEDVPADHLAVARAHQVVKPRKK